MLLRLPRRWFAGGRLRQFPPLRTTPLPSSISASKSPENDASATPTLDAYFPLDPPPDTPKDPEYNTALKLLSTMIRDVEKVAVFPNALVVVPVQGLEDGANRLTATELLALLEANRLGREVQVIALAERGGIGQEALTDILASVKSYVPRPIPQGTIAKWWK